MSGLQGQGTGTIAIAATFTAEPLQATLNFVFEQAGLAFDVRFAPYNQVFQELLGPTSLLRRNAGGIDAVLVRVEDFTRETRDSGEALAVLKRTVPELCRALTQHAQHAEVPTLLAVLPPSPRVAAELVPEFEAANATLIAQAAGF